MPDVQDQFKRSLLRMLQAGAFDEMLGCEHGQSAAVEFRLQRVYRVYLRRRTVVLKERDSETVSRKLDGRWQRLGRPTVLLDRVVLKRHLGAGQTPSGRGAKGTRRASRRREQPAVASAA